MTPVMPQKKEKAYLKFTALTGGNGQILQQPETSCCAKTTLVIE